MHSIRRVGSRGRGMSVGICLARLHHARLVASRSCVAPGRTRALYLLRYVYLARGPPGSLEIRKLIDGKRDEQKANKQPYKAQKTETHVGVAAFANVSFPRLGCTRHPSRQFRNPSKVKGPPRHLYSHLRLTILQLLLMKNCSREV